MATEYGKRLTWIAVYMRYLKMMSDRKTGYSPLNAEHNRCVTNDVMYAYAHEKTNILLSVFSILYLSFYDLNLNTQGFEYLEFDKYQLGLYRNVQVFAKCNVCISAIQLFYIETCPCFLHISKWIVYLSDARVSEKWLLESLLFNIVLLLNANCNIFMNSI